MAIADQWQIPVSASDRHGLVGEVYRGMRDIRAVRDCWDTLDPGEQQVVRLLAVAKDAPSLSITVAELAVFLEQGFDETWELAASLYRKGILAREGNDDEIPIGESPRVFLPRELALLFRRVQDELDAGDLSHTRLPVLLELLDDAEIEHAAGIWGKHVTPGVDRREELTAFLIEATGDPASRAKVFARLSEHAAHVLQGVINAEPKGPVPLETVYEWFPTGPTPLSEVSIRRRVIGDLESALLVWHSYDDQGERSLFVPADVRQSVTSDSSDVVEPVPVDPDVVVSALAVNPYMVAWDQLTLLRGIVAARSPGIESVATASPRWRETINSRLWHEQRDPEQLTGYLDFLIALMRMESVVTGGAGEKTPLASGPGWDLWRKRSFQEQVSHLLWFWLSHSAWIEGGAEREVVVDHANWSQARRHLIVRLAELPVGQWFDLATVADSIASKDSDLFGDEATAELVGGPMRNETAENRRRTAVSRMITSLLLTGFAWFGFVDVGRLREGGVAIRITDRLQAFARTEPLPDYPVRAGAPLEIEPDLTVSLINPSPIRVWSLTAFAEQRTLRPEPRYQITEASVLRALESGFRIADITDFLRNQSGAELTQVQLDRLQTYAGTYKRAWISGQVLVELDDRSETEKVLAALREAGMRAVESEKGLIVSAQTSESLDLLQRTVQKLLSDNGLTPQTRSSPAVQPIAKEVDRKPTDAS